MLFRKKEKNILNWYKNSKSALLVSGARQVGKTFLIENTLTNYKIPFVKVNLINQKEYLESLNIALNKSSEEFFVALSNIFNNELKPGCVIFIDEVQECKEIVTMIKFLVQNTQYKYVLSGSLLGVELINLRSAPVGYLDYLELHPLDFEEFLIACNVSRETIEQLKYCFDNKKAVNEVMHYKIMNLFYKYLIIGGMPQAVSKFVETKELQSVRNIQESVHNSYLKDFTKYETIDKKLKIISAYNIIPSELNSKTKRYIFSEIDKSNRLARYENTINWLIDAGVALPVFNTTEVKLPLEINKKQNLFKFFLSDVGLLTNRYGAATTIKLLENGKDINCGAIYENIVAQELHAHGFKTYYYNNKKHGEIDFLIEYNGNVLPIEVKSGKEYKKHSALNYFNSINCFKEAIVFNNYNLSKENNILYLPVYMVMFLENNKTLDIKINIDVEGL